MDSDQDEGELPWDEEEELHEELKAHLKGIEDEDQEEEELYEDDYFDSDNDDNDEGMSHAPKRSSKHRVLTNDELLYDEDEDESNEAWVTENLMLKEDPKDKGKKQSIEKILDRTRRKPRESDAVLSCPACFTILCYDCQQHEVYSNQFRAMFVLKCQVVKEETLKYFPEKHHSKVSQGKKKKKKGASAMAPQPEEPPAPGPEQEPELYHPVKCATCTTVVAVMDKDEVFHFFNVIAGN